MPTKYKSNTVRKFSTRILSKNSKYMYWDRSAEKTEVSRGDPEHTAIEQCDHCLHCLTFNLH